MPNDATDVTNGAPNHDGYVKNGNGTVTDLVTGLVWQQAVDPGTYTWQEAQAYCSITLSNQGLGGYHDWRVPSEIELISLLDYTVSNAAAIDANFFPSTPKAIFWSSTPAPSPSPYAWEVDFGYYGGGFNTFDDVSVMYNVRCTR